MCEKIREKSQTVFGEQTLQWHHNISASSRERVRVKTTHCDSNFFQNHIVKLSLAIVVVWTIKRASPMIPGYLVPCFVSTERPLVTEMTSCLFKRLVKLWVVGPIVVFLSIHLTLPYSNTFLVKYIKLYIWKENYCFVTEHGYHLYMVHHVVVNGEQHRERDFTDILVSFLCCFGHRWPSHIPGFLDYAKRRNTHGTLCSHKLNGTGNSSFLVPSDFITHTP